MGECQSSAKARVERQGQGYGGRDVEPGLEIRKTDWVHKRQAPGSRVAVQTRAVGPRTTYPGRSGQGAPLGGSQIMLAQPFPQESKADDSSHQWTHQQALSPTCFRLSCKRCLSILSIRITTTQELRDEGNELQDGEATCQRSHRWK